MKTRNKIIGLLGVLIVGVIIWVNTRVDKEVNLIYDTSLAAGDTMLVGPVYVGATPNVAIMLQAGDTVDAKVTTYYAYGTGQRISVAATDTVSAVGTSVPVSTGKVLRGYGLATDKIPGANYIYLKFYLNAAPSTTGEYLKCGLITAP